MKRICSNLKLLTYSISILCCLTNIALAVESIKVSSTIGPIDAGIIPLLAQKYEEKTGIKVLYEGAGTGATLKKAEQGGFDMVIVHARKLEDKFVAEGFGIDRRDIMYNDFIILGTPSDPAKIAGLKDAAKAFQQIAQSKAPFVTRGDNSGTHVKEKEIWEKAKLIPQSTESWYDTFAEGTKGNKATTLYADGKKAYVLMDRATYLILKPEISLVPLVEGDEILLNNIAAILVNPEKFPQAKHKEALAFLNWLVEDEAQEIIKNFQVEKYGEPLFFPNSDLWNAKNK